MARATQCASQLHQMGVGYVTYGSDYRQQLAGFVNAAVYGPPAQAGRHHTDFSTWKWHLYPYAAGAPAPYWPSTPTDGGRVYLCPSQEGLVAQSNNRLHYLISSYGKNQRIQAHLPQAGGGAGPVVANYTIRTSMDVTHPGTTLLLSDTGPPPNGPGFDTKFHHEHIYAWNLSSYQANIGPTRHLNQSGNVLRFDGSVTRMRGEDVSGPGSTYTQRLWLYDQNQ